MEYRSRTDAADYRRADPTRGLPPLPPGVGPVEKFADVSDTPEGKFLEGGAFDTNGNLWFVAIGSGWVSYLTPDGKLVPAFNCNPPAKFGQTCAPLEGWQALPNKPTPRHPHLRPRRRKR